MSSRMKLLLVAIAATIVFPLGASAGARAKDPRSKRLSLDDAAYYLDIVHELPPSFRPFSPEDAPSDETATVAYQSDETGASVVLHMTVGRGRFARAIMEELFESPEMLYTTDELISRFADQGAPIDKISVTPGEWTDVDAGDRAVTSVFTIDYEGVRMHFQVLAMLVGRGKDTALVDIVQVFAAIPTVDVAQVSASIAKKIRSGPPTREQTIAQAGLISVADLPAEYHEVSTTEHPDALTADRAAIRQIFAKTDRIPACEKFLAMWAAESGSGAGPSRSEGPEFESDAAHVSSQIAVYPTERPARTAIRVMRDRGTKTCVSGLYRGVVSANLESAASNLPAEQRKLLEAVEVKVATPRAPVVGDDRVLYVVTADLNPVRDAQFVVELEFVRVGRVVSLYTFSAVDGDTARDQVLPIVVDRLAAAQ
jgi:hypothetical protein